MTCRGCSISIQKTELLAALKCHQFAKGQVTKNYVQRKEDEDGRFFLSIDTSSTRKMRDILEELDKKIAAMPDAKERYSLVHLTRQLYEGGHFKDKYDNVSCISPELKESFIYKTFCHIGSSISAKCIGNALQRCMYQSEQTYHGIAFVPNCNRVIMLTKGQASMSRDEKTRRLTAEGEMPEKKEYLEIMELEYEPTTDVTDGHGLGVFTKLVQQYCIGGCVAG